MDGHIWLIVKGSMLILLPLVPAIILFKIFPSTTAIGSGPFGGMKWKLGGAFGGYVLVALLLFAYFKLDSVPESSTQLWRVEGRVLLEPDVAGAKRIELKTIPDRFQVDSNGSFVLAVAVQQLGEDPDFPALVAGGDLEDYPAQVVLLRNPIEFKGAAKPSINIDHRNRVVSITNPIVIKKRVPAVAAKPPATEAGK